MKKEKKPVGATAAVAKDSFKESNKPFPPARKDAEGNYIGDDGDRLFTRDEVSIILQKRMERYSKSLLEKYGLSSLDELEGLIMLADKVTEAAKIYGTSKACKAREEGLRRRKVADLKQKLEVIGNWNYISISKIQRSFGMSFPSAGRLFMILKEENLIVPTDNDTVAPDKEAIALFISKVN